MSARVEDKITNVGGVMFGLALVAWYAGGAGSIDRLVDASALLWACACVGVIATLVAVVVQARGHERGWRKALGNAVFFGAALLFASLMLAVLCNRFADSSPARVHSAYVRGFRDPDKGPRRVMLESRGVHSTLDAELAAGCVLGDTATMQLRDGALGQPWVSALHCATPR